MSYCVQCGVELSTYHGKCPLCKTEVINPLTTPTKINPDYPDYSTDSPEEKKRIKRYVTGIILSLQIFVYSVLNFLIDWLTGNGINWSLIPILSLALLWFSVAYPFFRKRNAFFRLFTYDCIAVILYLLALNYIISNNFIWSKYTTLSIVLLWVIIAGIFLTDRIRKVLPVTLFYVFCFVIISTITILFLDNPSSVSHIAVPIIITFFILSLISYFIIKSSYSGILVFFMVFLADISFLSLVIDLTLHNYFHSSFGVSWSVIVNAVTIPATSTIFAIKRSSELNLLISKKLHR